MSEANSRPPAPAYMSYHAWMHHSEANNLDMHLVTVAMPVRDALEGWSRL
jgi:hypothetical protein